MKHIWVIEFKSNSGWCPTTGTNLSRQDIRIKLRNWNREDPNGKYRVKKYIREDKP